MTPIQALDALKAIDPGIAYIEHDEVFGSYANINKHQYWAFNEFRAFNGDSWEDLIREVKEELNATA